MCVSLGPVSISLLKEQLPFALTHKHIHTQRYDSVSVRVDGESYVMSLAVEEDPAFRAMSQASI